jgi:hypothetical protein
MVPTDVFRQRIKMPFWQQVPATQLVANAATPAHP